MSLQENFVLRHWLQLGGIRLVGGGGETSRFKGRGCLFLWEVKKQF